MKELPFVIVKNHPKEADREEGVFRFRFSFPFLF